MKLTTKLTLFAVTAALLGLTGGAAAQEMRLPAASPAAMTMQTVGISEITVEYSSPGVKDRTIWGGLVPFGKLWRTGANAPTKLTVSTDVSIGGKTVKAGSYAILSVPEAQSFTFIISGDPKARTRSYKKENDAARVTVKPTQIAKRERMSFIFSQTTDGGTSLDLEWDTWRVSLPIAVATRDLALKGIDTYARTASRRLANAARYHAGTAKDLDKALAFIDRALAVHDTWFNNWIKADILAQREDYKAAYPYAEKAWEMGNKAEYFFWKDRVKKALEDWKAKR